MDADGRRELIQRHLSKGQKLEAELALLSKQTSEKQAVMERRLETLDKYLSLASPSVEDVDAAAAKLDVSRRQLYRLVARMRAHGPIRALVPGFQNVARASAAREGLAEPIEAALIAAMSREPDAKIAKLESVVSAYCMERGLTPPKGSTLRQRVHALRGSARINRDAPFGSRIVVDQISIDLPVMRMSGIVRFGTLTAIIDQSTRLILGASVSVQGWDEGLKSAVSNMLQVRVPVFKEQRFPVAVRMSELTWVVSPGLEKFASAVVGGTTASGRSADVTVINQGPRRHGEFIMRLLGDRLGPYLFRTRSVPGLDAECAEQRGTPPDDAEAMIGYCVDAWNQKLLVQLPKVMESDLRKRTQRLKRITTEVEAFFKPLLQQVEASFASRHVADY